MARNSTGSTYTIDGTDDTGADPVAITKVVDANWGNGSTTLNDVTHQASVVMEEQAGLPDSGSLTMELIDNPDDAGQVEILASQSTGTARTFVIVQSSGTLKTHTFNAVVTDFGVAQPVNGIATRSMTARIVNAIVLS